MFRRLVPLALVLSLTGCGPMLSALGGAMGSAPPPPQIAQIAQIAQISRGPIDFALHAFDAGIYAFDLAMDLKRPAPGTPEAKRISALGRRVLAALGAADMAQKAGSAATYDQAFREANTALDDFKQALGVPSATALLDQLPSARPILTQNDRMAVLARADNPNAGASRDVFGN